MRTTSWRDRSRTKRRSQPPACYRTRRRLRCTARWPNRDPRADRRQPANRLAGVGRRRLDRGRRLRLALTHRDLARLGLFANGNSDRQNAIVQVGFEVVQVETVAELDLPAERAAIALGEVRLIVLLPLPLTFGGDRQYVALDGDLQTVGLHARKVDVDPDVTATPEGVHGHDAVAVRPSRTQPIEQCVEVAERIGLDQHERAPFWLCHRTQNTGASLCPAR